MRRINFKTHPSERSYTLTVQDGSENIIDMVGGSSPITTQMDDSDDPFTPVRTQSGYINLVGAVGDIDALVSAAPKDRKVELFCGSTLVWRGFLQCVTYSQSWDAAPLEISIPIASPLAILSSFRPSNDMADHGYWTFAKLLADIADCMGASIYESFSFPVYGNAMNVLTWRFNMQKYAKYNSQKREWSMSSYYEMLEDMCKLFGWQCQERGSELVFLTLDRSDSATSAGKEYHSIRLTSAQMKSLAQGSAVTPEYLSRSQQELDVYGVDHQLDYLGGFKEIKVSTSIEYEDKELYKLDVEKQADFDVADSKRYQTSVNYLLSLEYRPNAAEIEVFNSAPAGAHKYDLMQLSAQKEVDVCPYYGGSLSADAFVELRTDFWEYDGLEPRLITYSKDDQDDPYLCARVHTHKYYRHTGVNNDRRFLHIDADLETSVNWHTPWVTANGIFLFVAIRIGNKYYNRTTQEWTDGPLVWTCIASGGKLLDVKQWYYEEGIYATLPTDDTEGEIMIEFYNAQKGIDSDHKNIFIGWKNINVDFVKPWRRIMTDDVKPEDNTEELVLQNGFTDTYSQENALTTVQSTLWDDAKNFVLRNDYSIADDYYGSQFPEEALANRIKDFYNVSRQKVTVEVRGGSEMFVAADSYKLIGESYRIEHQGIDWAKESATVGLIAEY